MNSKQDMRMSINKLKSKKSIRMKIRHEKVNKAKSLGPKSRTRRTLTSI